MKELTITLLVLAISFSSCTNESEPPAPNIENLEEVSFTFAEDDVIVLPPGIVESTNEYATLVTEWAIKANTINLYTTFFKVPKEASKSSTPIKTSLNSVSEDGENYLVYTWSESSLESSFAYQVHAEGDKYIFEVFFKEDMEDAWHLYLYAEQNKIVSQGLLYIYDIFGEETDIVLNYKWQEVDGFIYFSVTEQQFYLLNFIQNTTTLAGEIEQRYGEDLIYQIAWDANGNGTFVNYDFEGNITDQGDWFFD